MNIDVQPGRYVVAVSGGVDSMALLHALQAQSDVTLVVSHFDHGIRHDSYKDRLIVEHTAGSYGLPFTSAVGNLGAQASEATAREARYRFLEQVRRQYGARAIITAHHQDDVLETAILNLLRGTGRKGLTSLSSRTDVVRPLLHLTKQEIRGYAAANGLRWREDGTNSDDKYLRNYIRLRLLPRFSAQDRQQLLQIIDRLRDINRELDGQLSNLLHVQPHTHQLRRQEFIQLPHAVAKELLASWLRARGVTNFDTRALERVAIAAKTLAPGAIIDVVGGAKLRIGKQTLALERSER